MPCHSDPPAGGEESPLYYHIFNSYRTQVIHNIIISNLQVSNDSLTNSLYTTHPLIRESLLSTRSYFQKCLQFP